VTKSTTTAVARLLPEMGVFDLGESRPQELARKAAELPSSIRWHLIGHLQRNKVERVVPLVQLIHSVDSLRLLAALEQEALVQDQDISVLLEVNASREPNKHGFRPEEMPGIAPQLAGLTRVRVCGLMTMAALAEDPEKARPTFAALRQLRDELPGRCGAPHPLDQLSMGMSDDFEVAVEEGATMVRIGSALFEGLEEQCTTNPL
jgi:pyridoxal phosphate enzyme (YggS family)